MFDTTVLHFEKACVTPLPFIVNPPDYVFLLKFHPYPFINTHLVYEIFLRCRPPANTPSSTISCQRVSVIMALSISIVFAWNLLHEEDILIHRGQINYQKHAITHDKKNSVVLVMLWNKICRKYLVSINPLFLTDVFRKSYRRHRPYSEKWNIFSVDLDIEALAIDMQIFQAF